MYTMLFAHLNSSFNPLVYAISNPLFQKGYKNLFNKMAFWKYRKVTERSLRLNICSASGVTGTQPS